MVTQPLFLHKCCWLLLHKCCWLQNFSVVDDDSLLIVVPIRGFCVCCSFLSVLSSFAINLMRKRELVALLCLYSGFLWLLLFCGSCSRCRGLVCSVWSLCFLIILTCFSAAKVSENVAQGWLKKQAIWQIYLPVPRHIPRYKFDVRKPNEVHQADLLFCHIIRKASTHLNMLSL